MIVAALLFWSVRMLQQTLFWLYLWQLKEYHVGRFLDHMKSSRHRRAAAGPISGAAALLLLVLLVWPQLTLLAVLWYAVLAARLAHKRSLTAPVWTIKTRLLAVLLVVLLAVPAALSWAYLPGFFAPSLLLLDLASPLLLSLGILAFQPFAALGRRRVLLRARRRRESFERLRVAGITGSYGKTTTKEMASALLRSVLKTAKTKEHVNSEIGVARTILNDLDETHEVFVCEMGAYNKGGIALLAEIARPQIAVLTGANAQHLATFKSMENLLLAEGGEELVAFLPDGAPVIVNVESALLAERLPGWREKYDRRYVACGRAGEVAAENAKADTASLSFTISARGEKAEVKSRVLGAHNVQNMLLAAALALELGMSLKEAAAGLSSLSPDVGALRVRKNGFVKVDSTFSANPDGVLADLDYLALWEGKKGVVMPSLIELGPASREVHEKIGRKIAEVCDVAVITTREHFDDIVKGGAPAVLAESPRKAKAILAQEFSGGGAVLFEGRVPKELL